MRRQIHLAALLTTVLIGTSAIALAQSASGFRQIDASNGFSQLLRSNSVHYWDWMKKRAPQSPLLPYLGATGIVAGDPHMGNFSVIPVSIKGQRVFRYLNIDFDDAGQAPFALDFVRFATVMKAEERDLEKKSKVDLGVKIDDLLNAYIDGLNGIRMKAPKEVTEALKTNLGDYDREMQVYVDRQTKKDKLELKKGELEPYNGPLSESEIRSLFPRDTVLDWANRVKERGGSADALRVWVLTRDPEGSRHIYELKGWQEPGVAHYQAQNKVMENVLAVRQAFWKDIDPDSYDLARPRDHVRVWVREKKRDLYEVPRGSKKPSDCETVIKHALFIANQLGLVHGSQTSSAPLQKMLVNEANRLAFVEATKEIVKSYLNEAGQSMK